MISLKNTSRKILWLSLTLLTFSSNADNITVKENTKQDINFNQLLQPVPEYAKFIDPDYYIWGASMVKGKQGKYHLFYSRWKKEHGHNAWLTRSEIAHAVADNPTGPYKHHDVTLPARSASYWDGLTTHNPTIHKFGEKYYLYYMGTTGDGKVVKGFNWSHRNNQRIGVAVANSPYGPWQRSDTPLIDVRDNEQALDALMVSNPSIALRDDGTFVLVYKAVAKHKPLPGGGPVVHLVATSTQPDQGFVKHPDPVFTAKGKGFPAEDPFIWTQDGTLWAIVKDMHGVFTKAGQSLALFTSTDGIDWQVANSPLVSTLKIDWQASGVEKVAHLERPQLWLENGVPRVLFCAVDTTRAHSYNVHIPLKTPSAN
ncbi:MAG: glycoside hydrolase family protein [Thalassotalea sp.]